VGCLEKQEEADLQYLHVDKPSCSDIGKKNVAGFENVLEKQEEADLQYLHVDKPSCSSMGKKM
jgi:hypothetical protein